MSDSNSSSAQTTSNTDNRAVLGEGALQAREGSTVISNSIDPGAILLAGKVAEAAPAYAASTLKTVLDFASRTTDAATKASADAITQAGNFANDAYKDAKGTGSSSQLTLALIAVAGLAVVFALKGKKA